LNLFALSRLQNFIAPEFGLTRLQATDKSKRRAEILSRASYEFNVSRTAKRLDLKI